MLDTICPTCSRSAHVTSDGRIGNHPDSTGLRCPATTQPATSTFERSAPLNPSSTTPAVPAPAPTGHSSRIKTEYAERLSVERHTDSGSTETWSVPYDWRIHTKVWELQGRTREEFEADQRRIDDEWERTRQKAIDEWAEKQPGYSSSGGSIRTVNAGAPTLGRRR